MVWLPDGENNVKDVFIRFDRIHECDRQTHRQTGRHHMTAKAAVDENFYRAVKMAPFDKTYTYEFLLVRHFKYIYILSLSISLTSLLYRF